MQHKFVMNKALEQKLIEPMEEWHTKQQYPKAVLWKELWARRSKIAAKWARTRAWAGYSCLWEEEEVCGCKNKWRRATMGPRGRGRAKGVGRALHPHGQVDAPCCVLNAKYSQIFQKKSYLNFRAFGELLFSGYFLLHRWLRKQIEKKYYFPLFNINNRK